MRLTLMRCLPALLFAVLTASADAQAITLATWEIPGSVDNASNGVQIEIAQQIRQRTGLDFDIRLYPPKRAAQLFGNGEVDGIFPDTGTGDEPSAIRSDSFAQVRFHALLRRDRPPVLGIGDMHGLRVGLVNGYAYPNELLRDPLVTLDYTNTADAGMRKLLAGRLDVLIEDGRTLFALLRRHGQQAELRVSRYPVFVIDAHFSFQASDAGRRLVSAFNQALEQMRRDGTLARILAGGPPRPTD